MKLIKKIITTTSHIFFSTLEKVFFIKGNRIKTISLSSKDKFIDENKWVIIDLRYKAEYKKLFPNAHNVSKVNFETNIDNVLVHHQNKKILVMDLDDKTCSAYARKILNYGYKKVYILTNGIKELV